jgi:hypothetical protein
MSVVTPNFPHVYSAHTRALRLVPISDPWVESCVHQQSKAVIYNQISEILITPTIPLPSSLWYSDDIMECQNSDCEWGKLFIEGTVTTDYLHLLGVLVRMY